MSSTIAASYASVDAQEQSIVLSMRPLTHALCCQCPWIVLNTVVQPTCISPTATCMCVLVTVASPVTRPLHLRFGARLPHAQVTRLQRVACGVVLPCLPRRARPRVRARQPRQARRRPHPAFLHLHLPPLDGTGAGAGLPCIMLPHGCGAPGAPAAAAAVAQGGGAGGGRRRQVAAPPAVAVTVAVQQRPAVSCTQAEGYQQEQEPETRTGWGAGSSRGGLM